MNSTHERGGYSADVSLTLRVNGCLFPAAQIGPHSVVLEQPSALPDGPAEMIAVIDGQETRWPVKIENRGLVRDIVPVELER